MDSNSKMAIGRSEDRDNPWGPMVLRHHNDVRNPIRVTHLGQRSTDRTTKAGHMTAADRSRSSCQSSCKTGAVHIWAPALRRGDDYSRGGLSWRRDRQAAGDAVLLDQPRDEPGALRFLDKIAQELRTGGVL